MAALLLIGFVGAVLVLYVAERLLKARRRAHKLRRMSDRLDAATRRAEHQHEQRQAVAQASAALTSFMPAIKAPPLTVPGTEVQVGQTGAEVEAESESAPEAEAEAQPKAKSDRERAGRPDHAQARRGPRTGEQRAHTGEQPRVHTAEQPRVHTAEQPRVHTAEQPRVRTGEHAVRSGEHPVRSGEHGVRSRTH